jgi:hypothetical protein
VVAEPRATRPRGICARTPATVAQSAVTS